MLKKQTFCFGLNFLQNFLMKKKTFCLLAASKFYYTSMYLDYIICDENASFLTLFLSAQWAIDSPDFHLAPSMMCE